MFFGFVKFATDERRRGWSIVALVAEESYQLSVQHFKLARCLPWEGSPNVGQEHVDLLWTGEREGSMKPWPDQCRAKSNYDKHGVTVC